MPTEEILTPRWKTFTALATLFCIGFFYRVSMAVAGRDITRDLGLDAVQLGIVSGVFFYAFAFTQIPLGPLLDRFSTRLVLGCFGILTTAGAFIFALSPGCYTAVAGRILLGMGTASVLMGSLKIFTNWFTVEEFPSVSGYLVAAGNLGNVLATAPLAFAISHFSWRAAFLAAGLVQAAVTAAVFLVVKDSPSTVTRKEPHCGIIRGWITVLGIPGFWFIALIAFFWYANYMVLLALWGGAYLRDAVHLSGPQAGNVLLCTSLGFIVGSLFLGKLIKRVFGSLENTILSGQFLLACGMTGTLGLAESLSRPALWAMFFIIGLGSSTGVIIYPLARNLIHDKLSGTAMTCVNFFLLMGAACGQLIIGVYIGSFTRGPFGYPAAAYHGGFLIPICGLSMSLLLFHLFRKGPRPTQPPITQQAQTDGNAHI